MKKSIKLLLISAIFLAAFLLILLFINNSYFSPLDSEVNLLSEKISNSFLITISEAIAFLFDPVSAIIIILLLAVVMFIKKFKKDSLFFALSGLSGGILIYLLKEIVHRARPLNSTVSESSFSFPSGHALISIILFGFLIYFSFKYLKCQEPWTEVHGVKRRAVLEQYQKSNVTPCLNKEGQGFLKSKPLKIVISLISILLILAVGASRLVLNVHWLSDVLGGWFLGLFILFFFLSVRKA